MPGRTIGFGREAEDINPERDRAHIGASGTLVMSMLALDALALRVIGALETAGLPVLLMKGPVTNWWLFAGAPLGHVYTDVDLLVASSDWERSCEFIRRAGFRDHHAEVLGIYRPTHETAWVSSDGVVDLHSSLWGIPEASAEEAWRGFLADAEVFTLHGRAVPILGTKARALQLALHAAHAGSGEKAVRDLAQARKVLPEALWRSAAGLAEHLGAEAAFAAGLLCLDDGEELLGRLALQWSASPMTYLARRRAMPEAMAVARLHEAGAGERRQMIATWLSLGGGEHTRRARASARAKALGRLPLGVLQWVWAVVVTARQRTRRPR